MRELVNKQAILAAIAVSLVFFLAWFLFAAALLALSTFLPPWRSAAALGGVFVASGALAWLFLRLAPAGTDLKKVPWYLLPWYLLPEIKDHKDGTLFGVRTVGGAAYEFRKGTVEIFAELAPLLSLSADPGLGLDGSVGVRYYFGMAQ